LLGTFCARHGIAGEPVDPEVLDALQETIRKGLLALADPALAHELARRCLQGEGSQGAQLLQRAPVAALRRMDQSISGGVAMVVATTMKTAAA
jgi:hypothetical protein